MNNNLPWNWGEALVSGKEFPGPHPEIMRAATRAVGVRASTSSPGSVWSCVNGTRDVTDREPNGHALHIHGRTSSIHLCRGADNAELIAFGVSESYPAAAGTVLAPQVRDHCRPELVKSRNLGVTVSLAGGKVKVNAVLLRLLHMIPFYEEEAVPCLWIVDHALGVPGKIRIAGHIRVTEHFLPPL